jgi:DNA-binding NtrC family response regulator
MAVQVLLSRQSPQDFASKPLNKEENGMKCGYLQERERFFCILNEKLGPEFTFAPLEWSDLTEKRQLAGLQVMVVCVPPAHSELHKTRLEQLGQLVLNPAGIPVVAFLPSPVLELIREVSGRGAYDYFAETQSMEELRIVLRRASRHFEIAGTVTPPRPEAPGSQTFSGLLGADPAMTTIIQLAHKIAPTPANVLITGETGTGKELLARAIHHSSTRADQPFMALACSSLPETLIEAELFGHEKGAFTGAVSTRRGRFEAVERGTIFLDEIGELTPALQVKLLRVLQERTFERLGSNVARPMNARVVCATNRDLRAMAHAGQFRLDLYYRLNTITLHMPPLRERSSDILLLAAKFLEQYAAELKRPARRFSAAALVSLRRYCWPGNVRELQHVIERAVLICDGAEIQVEHFPPELIGEFRPIDPELKPFDLEVRLFKRALIERSLRECGYNKVHAAKALQISRSSLHRLIEELEIGSAGANLYQSRPN